MSESLKEIRHAALNLLACREHSELELSRKLRRKGFDEKNIQEMMTILAQENLLNQTRFVENYIHYRRRKGLGPLKIQAELSERGVSYELIDQNLKINDNAWFVDVRAVWRKRFKDEIPTDYKTRAKQMRFLYARGFTVEQIESVFE